MAAKPHKIAIEETAGASDFIATVTAPAARRRAGHSFGPTPVHLTREQLEAKLDDGRVVAEVLEADPVLVLRAYKPAPQSEAEAPKE